MTGRKMPRPDQATRDLFAAVVPEDPAVQVRPMFGQLAAFVNGNMFMGIHGPDLFVRLPEAEREELLGSGGGPFEPMPGRPMREYVVLPPAWRSEPDGIRIWVARSLDHVRAMPPKASARR